LGDARLDIFQLVKPRERTSVPKFEIRENRGEFVAAAHEGIRQNPVILQLKISAEPDRNP